MKRIIDTVSRVVEIQSRIGATLEAAQPTVLGIIVSAVVRIKVVQGVGVFRFLRHALKQRPDLGPQILNRGGFRFLLGICMPQSSRVVYVSLRALSDELGDPEVPFLVKKKGKLLLRG